jgi:imidazoleglycerol phosphate synthase glutamine amidotransferase subunit HisH
VNVVVVRTGMANLASVLAALERLGVEARVTTDPEVVGGAERLVLPGVGAFGAAMQVIGETGLAEPIVRHVQERKPLLAVCLGLQVLCESSEESPGVRGLGVVPGQVEKFTSGATKSLSDLQRIDEARPMLFGFHASGGEGSEHANRSGRSAASCTKSTKVHEDRPKADRSVRRGDSPCTGARPCRVPQLGWNGVKPTPGARLLREGHAYFANSYRLTEIPAGWEGATSDHGGPFVAALERGNTLACQFHPELSGAFGRDLLARWLEDAC